MTTLTTPDITITAHTDADGAPICFPNNTDLMTDAELQNAAARLTAELRTVLDLVRQWHPAEKHFRNRYETRVNPQFGWHDVKDWERAQRLMQKYSVLAADLDAELNFLYDALRRVDAELDRRHDETVDEYHPLINTA